MERPLGESGRLWKFLVLGFILESIYRNQLGLQNGAFWAYYRDMKSKNAMARKIKDEWVVMTAKGDFSFLSRKGTDFLEGKALPVTGKEGSWVTMAKSLNEAAPTSKQTDDESDSPGSSRSTRGLYLGDVATAMMGEYNLGDGVEGLTEKLEKTTIKSGRK